MTNKEIGELRRRMKPDRTNLTAVYGCYVASSGEVLSTFREPFGLMTEEDREKYLAIFRRALSGTPDKNLLDLSFTTKQENRAYIDVQEILPRVSADEAAVLRQLEGGKQPVDRMIDETQLPAGRVLSALTLLEVKGFVKRLPARYYELAKK